MPRERFLLQNFLKSDKIPDCYSIRLMKERGIECLTILSTCELVLDDTVDGKDNKEAKTLGVYDIRMNTSV